MNDLYYDGNDLGLSYSAAECLFKVWVPTAAYVSVALYDDAGEYDAAGMVTSQETGKLHPMKKDPHTGVWSTIIKGELAGRYYLYRAEFADGTKTWAADPYAKAVSANGQRMAIIDLAKTNPPGWREKPKPPFAAGQWQDAIIYELHVRDFSIDAASGMNHKGKYLAFTERGTTTKGGVPSGVDHLVALGITHVHLLPIYDFSSINEFAANAYNWGYDPMHYNVPEGSYATDPTNPAARIIECKQMIQALHDAGIRVIMDVVYNHTHHTGTWPFDSLVPGYYYRMTDAGGYANGSGCGNEVASERPMVRKFIIDSCRYWVNEYNIDGFRFDLMGLIDTGTMRQLTKELRAIDPTLIIYGEPWQAGGSVLPKALQTITGAQKGLGFAVFNDRFRTAIKGGSDDNSRGFASGGTAKEKGIVHGVMGSINDFTEQANESVNYVTAHDNLNLWDKFAHSLGKNSAVKSVLLANGIILTSQGIPFFQAGDEFLRSKFGNHNSYKSPDHVNKIRWKNAGRYREIVDYYAGLIRLRKEHPAFRQTSRADIERTMKMLSAQDMGVSFILTDAGTASAASWRTIFVAYNGSLSPHTFTLPASVPVWQQVVDARRAGTETLAKVSGSITLPPLSMAVLRE
ncbi:MAG: type I pullulanase [Treponema sp.]|nr:type I pullulanase [Treponema sp.]